MIHPPTAVPARARTPDALAPQGAAPAAGGVRLLLRAEGLAALALAGSLYAGTGRGWGLFAVLFLAPDLSFAAFLAGPRAGATAYNALHSYVGPVALVLLAHATAQPILLPLAYVWAAHIGFDRVLGYGLKYASSFGDTHLGRTGPPRGARRR